MKLGYSVLILAIVFSIPSYGQLYMNEFMASNASTIKDPVFQ